MSPNISTQSNARNLKPDILRQEIVEHVDQMERIEAGGDGEYASAMSVFPLVNLDDPDEEYYTMEGVRGPMPQTSFSAESPLGTLDLPSRESIVIDSYKKKYRPDKGAETELQNTPYSLYQRAAAVLRTEIFLTREQISWRGDDSIDGLIGQYGDDPHDDVASDGYVDTPGVSWDDADNATPYKDVTDAAFEVVNNGRMFNGQAQPLMYIPPSANRDMKQTKDFEDRIINTRVGAVNDGDVLDILDDDIGGVRKVLVYIPRTNQNGEYINESGNVVDNPDDAAHDNILEPYDPVDEEQKRHVIIMRPGAGTAFIPWFSDRLLERANDAPDPGNISIDEQNGFFTQVWNEHDPIGPNFKAAQEIGLHVQRPENIAILSDI